MNRLIPLLVLFLFLSSATGINASNVLNNLLDPKVYDKRLRPHFEGAPVNVYITVFLTSLGGVKEQEMQFEATFFLRQVWTDPRLAYGKSYTARNLTLGGEIMKQIWKPDTYINNEKSSVAPEKQFLLTIAPDGKVVYSQRMTVVASCMMDLRNYPMDTQTCSIKLESYGMNTDDLILNWLAGPGKESEDAISISNGLSLSQFALEKHSANRLHFTYPTGTFTLLELSVSIRRKKFYYVVQTYIPTILITILSWVSFWIPRSSPPARVALGITTVLALTTLIFGLQSSMPKVSYVKAMDWFLMVSFLFVFCALIEYPSSTFIKFHARKISRKGTTILKRVKGEKSQDEEMQNGGYKNKASKANTYGTTATNQMQEERNNDLRTMKRFRNQDNEDVNHVIMNHRAYEMNGMANAHAHGQTTDAENASYDDNFTDNEESNMVDRYARIAFPLVYLIYNIGYWTVYLLES